MTTIKVILLIVGFIMVVESAPHYNLLEYLSKLQMKLRLKPNLIGHWRFDEESPDQVLDDSGSQLHGTPSGALTYAMEGKYTGARYLNGRKAFIDIPNKPALKIGTNSFSFTGWNKIENYTYPFTAFAVLQGFGCDFGEGRSGASPGWDIGHGFRPGKTEVCIRDDKQIFVSGQIQHNPEASHDKLLGKWTHYAVVFNREAGKVFLYINGVMQSSTLDISTVEGSINNDRHLWFGYIHGWKTKGFLDEYRFYKTALTSEEVSMIYSDHTV